MKRIWLFVPDIFLALLIVVSCERITLDDDRTLVGGEKGYWSYTKDSPTTGNLWDDPFAAYKGKAKQFIDKLNLNL
jgi:hypothetical protein